MSQEKAPERRELHRIPCAGDNDLIIRIWRIAADDLIPKEPRPGADAQTTPVDLSPGGVGTLITDEDVQRLRLARGVFVGLMIQRRDARTIVHGEIRRLERRADGLMRLGITVQLGETSLERKRALLKFEALVAQVRRTELDTLAKHGAADAKPL